MKRRYIILLFIAFLASTHIFAQEEISEQEEFSKQDDESTVEIIPLPVIAYSGDTSLMLGAILMFVDTRDTNSNYSDSIQLMGIYTLKNQLTTNAVYTKNFGNGSFYNQGQLGYTYFIDNFYGIGPDSSEDDEELYTYRSIPLEQVVMFRITNELYIGPSYNFLYSEIIKTEDDGTLTNGDITGSDPTVVSMPGIRLAYDTRDNEFYPASGNFLQADLGANTKAMGATQDSQRLILDYRHFFDLYKGEYILGLQDIFTWQHGDVPLLLMDTIGGSEILRGYSGSRYLDKSGYKSQAELRYPLPFHNTFPVLRLFSGTLFAGVGNIAETPLDFKSKNTAFAWGTGLRFRVSQEEKINIRMDMAFNIEGGGDFYINFQEAF